MDIASLCPLPVGLVPWTSPEPTFTVVLKATFCLDRDGEARLAEEQEPLAGDQASAIDPDELLTATDFAPLKARADVLLVGHAVSAEPSTAIPVLFRVDGLTRRFFALAGAPATEIPLSAPYLRAASAEGEETVRVGPEAPWSPRRKHALGDRVLGADGLPLGPLGRGFDFGFFNAAPPEQQVELLRAGATLLLRGLLPGVDRREVRLPGLRPVVFLMRRSLSGRGTTDEIALRCDTLVIDADRALCTLTFRGVFEPPAEDDTACLLVDLVRPGDRPTARDLLRKLSRRGPEPSIPPGEEVAPPPRAPAPSTLTVEHDEDEPTGRHLAVPAPESLMGMGFRLGSPLGAAPIRASQPDPLELQPIPSRPEPPTQQFIEETIRVRRADLDATFAREEAEAAPPVTAPPHGRRDPLGDTASGPFVPLDAALPFHPIEPPHAAPPARPSAPSYPSFVPAIDAPEVDPRSATQTELAPEPAPALPFGGSGLGMRILAAPEPAPTPVPLIVPDPGATTLAAPAPVAAPAPRVALDLATFAAIKVALWEGARPRADLLREHGLDEIRFRLEEERWASEIAAAARAGKPERALALHAALREAEARIADGAALPLDRYVALRAAIEAGYDPSSLLAAEGLTPASYRRLHRAMSRRAAADPKLFAELRRALVDARRNL
ncbi:MAG: DUF2169 domain-containing protein [Byssovorax sp.]